MAAACTAHTRSERLCTRCTYGIYGTPCTSLYIALGILVHDGTHGNTEHTEHAHDYMLPMTPTPHAHDYMRPMTPTPHAHDYMLPMTPHRRTLVGR